MKLLSGIEERRLDVELDILSPNVFTGVIPVIFNQKNVEALNIYSFSPSSPTKNPDAILLGPARPGDSYLYKGQAIRAYGTYEKPYDETIPTHQYLGSQFTGQFVNQPRAEIYNTCHAWLNNSARIGTYNYYHAFHPYGYYSPPFGEVISLSEFVDENSIVGEPLDNGSCAQITNAEYMQMKGIVTVTYAKTTLRATNDGANRILPRIAPIDSPYEECPPDIQPAFYFEEILFNTTAGTYAGGVVGNSYNHNPIPTSLDFSEMQLTSRYNVSEIEVDGHTTPVISEQGGNIHSEMKLISNYGTGISSDKNGINNDLTLNNRLSYKNLCMASSMEGSTTAGLYGGGAIELKDYNPASPLNAGSITPTFDYNPWSYWNFTFKENHDTLPFLNNFNSTSNGRSSSRGTALLWAKKADTDHWWENRQCPEVVDFLPFSFGATVYDCPRDYFEIPYYSSLGKFGYFGTRFQVTCKTLQRLTSNDKSGEKGPLEVFEKPYPMDETENELDSEVDGGGASSDYYFRGLLETAQREQAYSEWLVTNKSTRLSFNYNLITGDSDYGFILSDSPKFQHLFLSLIQSTRESSSNLPNYITGSNDSPCIKVDSSYEEDYGFYQSYNRFSNSNLNGDSYEKFVRDSRKILSPASLVKFESLIEKYGYFYKKNSTTVNWEAYKSGEEAQETRLRTRALLNISQGNPVDLFPTNHISYSFDNREDYEKSPRWGRMWEGSISNSSQAGGLQLPVVERRYFEGCYSKTSDRDRVFSEINKVIPHALIPTSLAPTQGFSDGRFYKNDKCGAMAVSPNYYPVTGGNGFNNTQNPSLIGLIDNWMMLGYNEIGKINSNFSCFTPIFIQQPKNVYCKLGQQPTMRALAVDYHTIPEDKMKVKHPEVWFWANQLKIVDNAKRNLYPISYHWGRVREDYVSEFMQGKFFDTPTVEWASSTGAWGCLEGDNSSTCTIIHPSECVKSDGTIGYGSSNKDDYRFLQGVKEDDCIRKVYFCLAYGRFGFRCSDLFSIEADKFTLVDIAYINGGGASVSPEVNFELPSSVVNGALQVGGPVTISSTCETPAGVVGMPFNGIKSDNWIIPEEVVIKQRYMRAGGGQNVAFGFNGDYMFRGFLRSYAPETLQDTRGLRGTNQQPVDYGILLNYKVVLDDTIGGQLYGHKHLPTCRNGIMEDGEAGVRLSIKVDGEEMHHPLAIEKAEIPMTNPPAPMNGAKPAIVHLGQLYNHESPTSMGVTTSWQFHQNLGAIKRFGKATTYAGKGTDFIFVNDRSSSNPAGAQEAFDFVHDEICTNSDLGGANCGYHPASIGRKMIYYVEAFERFYILCDQKAKYNVPNKSFIAPGLRYGDAPMQYAWFGQPSDTYLERYSMYGAYAFQWKVKRHNRDRLGNGISQGLWSMGWRDKYSLMYDLAAVYGMYLKNTSQATKDIVADINAARQIAFPNSFPPPRRLKLGRRGNSAEGYGYGDIRFDCDQVMTNTSTSNVLTNPSTASQAEAMCAYYSLGSSSLINSSEYYCSIKHIQDKVCFDPCMSIRYSHGFWPGGKFITHMTAGAAENDMGSGPKKRHKITHNGQDVGEGFLSDVHNTNASSDLMMDDKGSAGISTLLRGPAFTPYSKGIRNGDLSIAAPSPNLSPELQASTGHPDSPSNRLSWSISPCEPGGTEHCNFMTPTVHLGGNVPLRTRVTSLTSSNNSISSMIT